MEQYHYTAAALLHLRQPTLALRPTGLLSSPSLPLSLTLQLSNDYSGDLLVDCTGSLTGALCIKANVIANQERSREMVY